jgi:hypothetical protein
MKKLLVYLVPFLMAFSCEEDPLKSKCEAMVLTNDLAGVRTDEYSIDTAYVEGNCLKLRVAYGGGAGASAVKFEMYQGKQVAESIPPQRWLKLVLDDQDYAKAIIRRELSYDLTSTKVDTKGAVLLNLEGYNKRLLYQY